MNANPWSRQGLHYIVNFRLYDAKTHQFVGVKQIRYFFITYWLIVWIHGEEEMIRLGSRSAWRIK
jgi:hypothetical protein